MRFVWISILAGILLPALAMADAPATRPDDGSYLQTCLAAAADFSPVYATHRFADPKEICAVYRVAEGESFQHMSYAWRVVDVDGRAPGTILAHGDLKDTTSGELHLQTPAGLPIGDYDVEITADGEVWKTKDFEVTGPIAPPQVNSVADLYPMEQGHTATYQFSLDFGLQKPTWEKYMMNGKDHLTDTLQAVVGGNDPDKGTSLQFVYQGKVISETWWRVTPSGIVYTPAKAQSFYQIPDLNQIVLPWPLSAPQAWGYEPSDNSYGILYHMWGPVALHTPDGIQAGYVVFSEEHVQGSETTCEYEFVPGLGMIREKVVDAMEGQMQRKWEMKMVSNN
jgi:hypothetical protein